MQFPYVHSDNLHNYLQHKASYIPMCSSNGRQKLTKIVLAYLDKNEPEHQLWSNSNIHNPLCGYTRNINEQNFCIVDPA